MLYGTTKEFLDFFSLGDLRELPTLREYSELTDESRQVMSDRLGIGLDETARAADDGDGEGGEGGEGGGGDGGGGDDGGTGGNGHGGNGHGGNGHGENGHGGFDPDGVPDGHGEVSFEASDDLDERTQIDAAASEVSVEAAADEVSVEASADDEDHGPIEAVMADEATTDEVRADDVDAAAVSAESGWPEGSGRVGEPSEQPLEAMASLEEASEETFGEVMDPLLVAEARVEHVVVESETE